MKWSRQISLLRFTVILMFLFALAACSPAAGVLPTQETPTSPDFPAIPELRLLTLAYPTLIPVGGDGRVTLTFEMEEGLVGIQDVFATHNLLAEARLELAGIEVRPGTTVSEPLLPGRPVTFFWSVIPSKAGKYEGTVWFYLRFVPKDGGPETRRVVSAQIVQIKALSFLGMSAKVTPILGFAGLFAGVMLAFPFLEQALRWVWGRVGRGRKPPE